MRKLRKNVHEKYLSLTRTLSLTLIFSGWPFFFRALSHRHARSHVRIKDLVASVLFWLSSRFPMRVKRNFLKLLDGSLPSSFLKADSRMEANYSETTTRESPRSFFDYYTSAERDSSCRTWSWVSSGESRGDVSRYRPKRRIATGARSLARSLAGEYRIDWVISL